MDSLPVTDIIDLTFDDDDDDDDNVCTSNERNETDQERNKGDTLLQVSPCNQNHVTETSDNNTTDEFINNETGNFNEETSRKTFESTNTLHAKQEIVDHPSTVTTSDQMMLAFDNDPSNPASGSTSPSSIQMRDRISCSFTTVPIDDAQQTLPSPPSATHEDDTNNNFDSSPLTNGATVGENDYTPILASKAALARGEKPKTQFASRPMRKGLESDDDYDKEEIRYTIDNQGKKVRYKSKGLPDRKGTTPYSSGELITFGQKKYMISRIDETAAVDDSKSPDKEYNYFDAEEAKEVSTAYNTFSSRINYDDYCFSDDSNQNKDDIFSLYAKTITSTDGRYEEKEGEEVPAVERNDVAECVDDTCVRKEIIEQNHIPNVNQSAISIPADINDTSVVIGMPQGSTDRDVTQSFAPLQLVSDALSTEAQAITSTTSDVESETKDDGINQSIEVETRAEMAKSTGKHKRVVSKKKQDAHREKSFSKQQIIDTIIDDSSEVDTTVNTESAQNTEEQRHREAFSLESLLEEFKEQVGGDVINVNDIVIPPVVDFPVTTAIDMIPRGTKRSVDAMGVTDPNKRGGKKTAPSKSPPLPLQMERTKSKSTIQKDLQSDSLKAGVSSQSKKSDISSMKGKSQKKPGVRLFFSNALSFDDVTNKGKTKKSTSLNRRNSTLSASSSDSGNKPSSEEDLIFLSDPILNPIEMELLFLGVESMYCMNTEHIVHSDYLPRKVEFQFDFVWHYATVSLKTKLRENDFDPFATESIREDDIIKRLVRMNDWIIHRRFSYIREELRLAYQRGFRRERMKRVVAYMRLVRRGILPPQYPLQSSSKPSQLFALRYRFPPLSS